MNQLARDYVAPNWLRVEGSEADRLKSKGVAMNVIKAPECYTRMTRPRNPPPPHGRTDPPDRPDPPDKAGSSDLSSSSAETPVSEVAIQVLVTPVIAYGDAVFAHNTRGSASTPIRRVSEPLRFSLPLPCSR